MKRLIILLAFFAAIGAGAAELSWGPGVYFSGSPSYVSEFATTFRDNGGPLSPFGSHIGLKAEVKEKDFAGVLHFACATGKDVYDYSRTGLAAVSSVGFVKDGVVVRQAKTRRIKFEYYGWQENAAFDGLFAESNVLFLGLNQYLISVKVKNTGDKAVSLIPVLYLKQKGKMFTQLKSEGGPLVFKFAVQPILRPGENFLAIATSAPTDEVIKAGKGREFQIGAKELKLAPNEISEFWYVFGYDPDSQNRAKELAQSGLKDLHSPLIAWSEMARTRDEMFQSLPKPHLKQEQTDYHDLYLMAATALDNALYAPRGAMKYWGCVPTKVHYNWFWLWDSGFEALGYSEFKPKMATDVIQAIFQAQRADGFIAHMEDERAKPITPHSQPPVFGFSGGKMIERYGDDPGYQAFEKEMYEKGGLFIDWWKRTRDENHNGVFEYISQDEGGWDNSTRMKYVHTGFFISYLGSVGEVVGSKIKPLDNADLNPWMYFYYDAMADWADDLGKPAEAKKWRAQARELAGKVDQILWDNDCGCWLDGYNWKGSKKYHHFKTLTPAIWFPAFAGSTLDEKKARAVIENHVLNPKEFYGKYPMPVVAYNDKYFDDKIPGWTASIWIFSAYGALEALFKFGYEKEAEELREKLLAMMADQDGMKGIYETYDPITGKYKNKYSTGGYASTQFGWSSAFTLEMILQRYQEQRFIFADTKKIAGFIRKAPDFATRELFYKIKTGLDTPNLELESADGAPLLQAKSVKIKISDPYQSFTTKTFKVWLKGKPFDLELGKEYKLSLD
jgi:hypothetical protein